MRYIVSSIPAYPPPHKLAFCRHLCSGKSYAKGPHKPAGDMELAGHAVHAPAPGESLCVPASHAVHVPPLGPVYPALHVQSSRASLPACTCAQMRAHTFTNADTHASENLCPCVRVYVCVRVCVCVCVRVCV